MPKRVRSSKISNVSISHATKKNSPEGLRVPVAPRGSKQRNPRTVSDAFGFEVKRRGSDLLDTRKEPSEAVSSDTTRALTDVEVLLLLLRKELSSMQDLSLQGLDLAQLAKSFARSIPSQSKSEWDDLIGPFYTSSSLQERLGVTRQWLHKLRSKNHLLATPTGDSTNLYPSFQISEKNELLPHLSSVVSLLSGAISDPWTIALWLNSKRPELNHRTPQELMRGDESAVHLVLQLAEEDARTRTAA